MVDDLLFFDEPFFADGPLAQTVRAAVQAGVSYHAAAGNQAEQHVEQPFRASSNGFHDFLGGPVDQTDDMVVAPGATLVCILQWNDPFGGSANDYDLFLLDSTLTLITSSTGTQNGTQDPLETVGVTSTSGSPQVVKAAINKFAGADRMLEMFCLDGDQQQYVSDGSVVVQGAVPEVVTVGAIDVSDPGRDDVESYSSHGPSQIFFPAPVMRPKPDLAGFDGVSITNAGGFPACPPFCAFFGTSAAAPHSAAVASLLLSKNPFLTPAEIQDALRASAVDIGAPGFDPVAGAGRLDALAAAALVPIPECTGAGQCDDADACTIDSCLRGTCAHAAILCSDGDPCTVDSCDAAAGCRSSELPGLEYLSCALEQHLRPLLPSMPNRPARALTTRLDRAERILAKAMRLPGRRQRAVLGRVRKAVVAMRGFARRRQDIFGQTTVQAIVLETNAIASRIRALQRTL